MSRFYENEELEELVANACLEKAFPVTVHFFQDSPTTVPQPLGCGVLFTFQNNFFIITAAHLLEGDVHNDLRVMVDGYLFPLQGIWRFIRNSVDEVQEYPQNVDLAVLKFIPCQLLAKLQQDRSFLELQHLAFDQQQIVSSSPEVTNALCGYHIVGYPSSRTKYDATANSYRSTMYVTYTTLHKKNLKRLRKKFNANHHLFFDYRTTGKDPKENNKVQLPTYGGLSGTGIWKVDYLVGADFNIKLGGIFLQTSQKESVMIGLKIDMIIQVIREAFNLPRLPKRDLSASL